MTTTQEIAAPIDWTFGELSDFAAFERMLSARGVSLKRVAGDGTGAGSRWHLGYEFRGARRETDLKVTAFEPPRRIALASETGGLDGAVEVQLSEASPDRTRMALAIDLSASNLRSKLLLKSLTLARGQIERQLDERVAGFAGSLGRRYAKTA